MATAKSAQDFEELVGQQTNDLTTKCQRWQQVLDEKAKEIGDKEDVKGQIFTTIGQARMLMKERFGQFTGLIEDCKLQRGERKTTTDDLAGFWDMISMQVDDINSKFALLDTAEKNKWCLPEVSSTAGSATKSRDSAALSNGAGNGEHNVSFESTDHVKEEAEKSATVKERRNELRSFIAQQKKEKQQQDDGNGELFVDIKAP